MIGTMIVLTNAEKRTSEYIGRARWENVDWRKEIIDDKVDDPPVWLAHTFGAELAYCRMRNVYPELDVRGPSHIDAILGNGDTVDVKKIDKPFHSLIRSAQFLNKSKLPDIYSLMFEAEPWVFVYCGSMTSKELITPKYYDPGRANGGIMPKACYRAPREDLY